MTKDNDVQMNIATCIEYINGRFTKMMVALSEKDYINAAIYAEHIALEWQAIHRLLHEEAFLRKRKGDAP